jgi:hypothetical protein
MNDLISGIWYLPSENTWQEFNTLAMKDKGSLSLQNGQLTFKGKQYEVKIENIESVSYGKQGRDFINNWVKIQFKNSSGKTETAFFADGNLMGWSGIFGGTKAIFNKIKSAYAK